MSIVNVNPNLNSLLSTASPTISITFSDDLDPNTINKNAISVYNSDTIDFVNFNLVYSNKVITVIITQNLDYNSNYSIMFKGGTKGILQLNPHNAEFDSNYTLTFKTKPNIIINGDIQPDDNENDNTQEDTNVSTGDFKLIDTTPINESINNDTNQVVFTFNKNITSYDGIEITADDVVYYPLEEESNIENYDIIVEDNTLIIKPKSSFHNKLRFATDYLITINSVVSEDDETINNVVLDFTTVLKPLYVSVKTIRNAFGDLLKGVTDAQLELLIYEASIYAYQWAANRFLLFKPTQAVIQFVFCYVKQLLFDRLFITTGGGVNSNTIIKRKTLADFTIEYGTDQAKFLTDLLKRINDCVESMGMKLGIDQYTVNDGGIQATVKSWNDPRKPIYPNPYYSWNRLGYGGRNSFIKRPINYRNARVKPKSKELTFTRYFGYEV